MSKNQKKQHIGQTSKKKKGIQKVNETMENGKKTVRSILDVLEKTAMIYAEYGSMAVSIMDCMPLFAYKQTEIYTSDPKQLQDAIQGLDYLIMFRKDLLVNIFKLHTFKVRVNEMYKMVKKKDVFNERFVEITKEIDDFRNSDMDVSKNLRKFWDLHKDNIIKSNVNPSLVVKMMSALGIPKEEIEKYIEDVKKRENENKTQVIDTSEIFEEENKTTDIDVSAQVEPITEETN